MKETRLLETSDNLVYNFLQDPLFIKQCIDPLVTILKPGDTVLDLACGIGMETRELERRGLKVIPLDEDLGWLKLIQNQFPECLGNSPRGVVARIGLAALGRKDFARKVLDLFSMGLDARNNRVLGMAEAIPLKAESVDAVVCKHYLIFGNEDERRQVLGEIERVLKPGGIALIFNEVREQDLHACGGCGRPFVGYAFNQDVLQELINGTSLKIESYEEYPIQEYDRFNSSKVRGENYQIKENMAAFLRKIPQQVI